MIDSSEDEEEYDDREMDPYEKGQRKHMYEGPPEVIKPPLPQDANAKANAIAAHWGGIKHALREEPIEEEVESEDGEQYAEREEDDEEEYGEEGEEEEAGGNESEEDSGYPLSQETARFNLQNMPMAQQIGMQMFAADKQHMLPPRQGAPPPMQNIGYPPGHYPPGGYPPGALPGHSVPPGFPAPAYAGYPGQYPAPYSAPYPGQYPATVPGQAGAYVAPPQQGHPSSVYQPQPYPLHEAPQPLKSGSHGSLGTQHSRSQTSILSQSQGSLVPSSKSPLGPEPQPLKPSTNSRGTSSQSNFKTMRDAPTINGIPYTAATMNYHQNHDYHAMGPREEDDVGGFIDATAGKSHSKRHHHRHSKRHKKKHRKKHSSSSTSSSDQVVEIAHLSMDMLKHDKNREKYPTPSSQKKINVPSHNLSDQYKEKHDTVKANNLKNKHGYSESVAVLSTTSSSPRMITHDQLFHHRDMADQNNVDNGPDSVQFTDQNVNRPNSAGSDVQGNSRPNSAMSSGSNRLLNRLQSSKSLLRQGGLNEQPNGNTATRNTSRPSSAPSLPRSIPSESPRIRPQSAKSWSKPDNRASSPRKDAFGESSNNYRPESARSNRPVSARSIKSRPMSARSTKSQASGIDIIDNLSRRSSGHITSNYKSNALKNQEQDAIIDEQIDEHTGINDHSGPSGDTNEKNGLLNNGSMPNLDEELVENEITDGNNPPDREPQNNGNIDGPLDQNKSSSNQNQMPANDGTDVKHESIYEPLPEAGDALKSTPSGSEAAI